MKNNEIQGGVHKSVINCSAGHMSTENVLCSASRFPPVKIRESIEKRPYLIRSRCKLNFYYKTKPTQKQAFEVFSLWQRIRWCLPYFSIQLNHVILGGNPRVSGRTAVFQRRIRHSA